MSRESFKAKLLAEAEQDMRVWGQRPIVMEMDIVTLMSICGALQLALRHPAFKDRPAAKQVRQFVNHCEGQIPPEFGGIKRMIQLGFHQRFDE